MLLFYQKLRVVIFFLFSLSSLYLYAGTVAYPSATQPGVATLTEQNNRWIFSNNLLSATFIKQDNQLIFGGSPEMNLLPDNDIFEIQFGNGIKIKSSEMKCVTLLPKNLEANNQAVKRSLQMNGKALTAIFTYKYLTVKWRAILRDGSHYLRTELEIFTTENIPMLNIVPLIYTVKNIKGNTVPIVVGNTRGSVIASNCLFAGIETHLGINSVTSSNAEASSIILGKWSRKTTLFTIDTFRVSTVVGLLASGQQRRSFLAYHERERAVPWRSFVLYNSWFELNINRNDFQDPMKRMNEAQCLSVLSAWKDKLFTKNKTNIDAFVWDDGWDDFNSLWSFHKGFPKGFSNINVKAKEQKSGIGTWLGPVGGYGASKKRRLAFWNSTHGTRLKNFQLSDKEYFDAFVGRCAQMVNDYEMRYFKFDGISDLFSALGPKNEEDAEGIINVISALRKKRQDIFFNCTVGTWASPFWLHYGDAVWRQEGDFSTIGNQGDKRERWITYRDRLVYQNFVQNAPFCPINSIMTHGLIVTKYGPPAVMPHDKTKTTYDGIVKEMRCAFACGSSMVELYLDNDLMSTIGENEALWADLVDCITWHRNNADVLSDSHWIGGNPWDGKNANIYGWAAWNEQKSTLTLRNPSGTTKTFSTTLRQALEIPSYIKGKILLKSAFNNQTNYTGITNQEINIDTAIEFNMPPFDVIVLNGVTVNP